MKIPFVIILLIFFGEISAQENFPKIIDSISNKSTDFSTKEKVSWEREVIYIGENKDTIISKEIEDRRIPIQNHYENPCDSDYEKREKRSFSGFLTSKLEIKVDTTQVIKFSKWNNGNAKYYNAYPMLIKNIDSKDVQIGYWYYIPALLEAKDENGNWKTIESYYVADCGTCMYQIFFKPNEILITTAVIYNGNYKTKLRIKLGDNYSNEYFGFINKGQIK